MKSLAAIALCLVLISISATTSLAADSTTRPTIHINNVDLPVPTEAQAKWQGLELGMFIHFDIEVFDKDYQTTHERGFAHKAMGEIDPKAMFNPKASRYRSMARCHKISARKYACFTCKHSSGFLMWQSDLYPYGVKQSPWKNGKGDVVQDYLASCRKAGIEPGLYCSAGGNSWWNVHRGQYQYRHGQITGKPEDVQAFVDMDLKMYEDLWSKTGAPIYMWFDGGINPFGERLNPLIEKYLPHTVCFNGPENGVPGGLARWSGNEKGFAPYPLWNTIDITDDQKDRGPGSPDGKYWVPVEANVPLRYHVWMWQSDTEPQILSLSTLMADYLNTVGNGSNFIINANIDPDGQVPAADANRLTEFGDTIRKWFGQSIAETSGRGETIELKLPQPTEIDFVSIMEDIRRGQRVRSYAVEGLVDGKWKKLCDGESIGHKRIQQFDRVKASAIRLHVTQSVAEPIIKKLAIYNIDPLPPDPTNPATTQNAGR